MNYFVKTYPYNIFALLNCVEGIVRLITFVRAKKTNENFMERQKCQKGSYAF